VTERTTMTNLIAELRGMTNAGSADYTIAGATYWTYEQLQNILDRHRKEVVRDELEELEEVGVGGTLITTRYYSHYGNYESMSGTTLFYLQNAAGSAVATATYTPDYFRGEVVFTSNTLGSAYYLTGRSYNMNAAAADVWERKASQAASAAYSWSTDNMRVDKSGLRKEALEQARYYRSLAGPTSVTMVRSDTDAECD
jgi:hypothetical protein